MSEKLESGWTIVYSSSLPTSGTLSLLAVNAHKDSLGSQASLVALCTTNVNPYEISSRKPSGVPPHTLTHFRGYRHKALGIDIINISISGSAQTIIRNICFFPSSSLSYQINNAFITSVSFNIAQETVSITISANHLSEPRSGSITLYGNGLSLTVIIDQAGMIM